MDPILIGALTAVISEIFQLLPALRSNDVVRSVVVLVVALGGVVLFGTVDLKDFATTLIAALTTYKLIVQPGAKALGSPTQV